MIGRKKPVLNQAGDLTDFDRDNITLRPFQPPLSYKVGNIQGIGKRESQQDSFGFANVLDVKKIAQQGLFAAVADGIGGMEGGKDASKAVIDSLRKDFDQMDRSRDLAEQLYQSVLRASDRVYGKLANGGGSTVIACIFYKDALYYAGVGDSCLILKRGSSLIHIHQPHNVQTRDIKEVIRSNDILYMEDYQSNGRSKSKLTDFMGKPDFPDVSYFRKPMPLRANDTLLLCTDGITDTLGHKEIYDCLKGSNPEKSCLWMDQIVHQHNRSKQDNYTAMVVWCGF